MEEYRKEVRGMYVALADVGAGSGTGEAAGDDVQQEILEEERMRLEVVKVTEVTDTVEDGTCSPIHLHAPEC